MRVFIHTVTAITYISWETPVVRQLEMESFGIRERRARALEYVREPSQETVDPFDPFKDF